MQRSCIYMARTVLVLNLPEHVTEQHLWPLLGDAMLEKRLVRDPLREGRKVAVLVYVNSVQASVQAATLGLRLAGTGAAAVLLQCYLNFYAQLEREALVKGEDDTLDCSLIVANVNPNAAAIPGVLESLFSTVGHLRQPSQLNPEIAVLEFSCGSEAQTAEFTFDNLDFGGYILFAKRVHTPLYNLPSLDVQEFVCDQLITRNKKNLSLEDTFADVLRRFDDSHGRQKGIYSKPLSKKIFRRHHVIEKVVSETKHNHTYKVPDAVHKLLFVDQNHSFSKKSVEEIYMQKSPLSPELNKSHSNCSFNYDSSIVDNYHTMSRNNNVAVSVGNNDMAFVKKPEMLAREIKEKKEEKKGNEDSIPAFVDDTSLSECSNNDKCLATILNDISSDAKKKMDFLLASSHDASAQGFTLYDVLKRSADFAENPPKLGVDSIHRSLEQLELWLKEIRERCSVVEPTNFETFNQYKEHVRSQIFAAYHEKFGNKHSARDAAESLPVADDSHTNKPDILDMLLSLQW